MFSYAINMPLTAVMVSSSGCVFIRAQAPNSESVFWHTKTLMEVARLISLGENLHFSLILQTDAAKRLASTPQTAAIRVTFTYTHTHTYTDVSYPDLQKNSLETRRQTQQGVGHFE